MKEIVFHTPNGEARTFRCFRGRCEFSGKYVASGANEKGSMACFSTGCQCDHVKEVEQPALSQKEGDNDKSASQNIL